MHTLIRHRYDPTDPRLGRHVEHDSRSLAYQVRAEPGAIVSARHYSTVGVLDQGQVGACTAFASVKALTYGPRPEAFPVSIEVDTLAAYALGFYSAEETLDGDGPYPPADNGSTGLTAGKVATARGLISGYQHATSLDAALTVLSQQAVITGTSWYADMFTPDVTGRIRTTGRLAGGHEYVLDEIDTATEKVWIQNSWGPGWGDQGRAWLSYADYQRLLADQGDVTVFTPATQPAPQPSDAKAVFEAAAQTWLSHRHTSAPNAALVQPLRDYLKEIS